MIRNISQNELKTLIELSPLPVLAISIDGCIQFLNNFFIKLTGFSREELIGSTLVKMGIVEHDFISNIVKKLENEASIENAEIYLHSYSGNGAVVSVSPELVEYEDKRLILIFFNDITEKKALEQKLDNVYSFSEALNSISTRIHSSLDSDMVMRLLLDEGVKGLGAESAAISLFDGDNRWIVRYVYGLPEEATGMEMNAAKETHAFLALKTYQPVPVNDVFGGPGIDYECFKLFNIRSVLVIPLVVRENPIGILFLNYHSWCHTFSYDEISFGRQLAATASIALDNAQMFTEKLRCAQERIVIQNERLQALEEQGRALRRFELLAWISGELLHSDMPKSVVQNLCEKVMEYLGCDTFFNYLIDDKRNQMILNAFAGITENDAQSIRVVQFGEAICGCVARDGSCVVVNNLDAVNDECVAVIKSFGIKAFACHPLTGRNGKTIGTLSFGMKSGDEFNEDDLAMMKAVADQVAVAMIRMQTDQKLRNYYDELEKLVEERTLKLKKSEQRLSAAINATGGGIYETSFPPGVECFYSDRWFEIFGIPKTEHPDCHELQMQIEPLIHPEDQTHLRNAIEKFVAGHTSNFSIEMRVKRTTGEWRYVQNMAYASLHDEDGHVKRMVGVILDVTQRKQLEEQLLHSQKMESLGRLAGGVAHDFNNMLQVITACSYRMMKNVGAESALSRDIEVIREAAQSSARLSHRLLAFSSKQILQPKLLCINKLVKRVHKLLSNSLREDVKVSIKLDDKVGNVFMDQDQMEQTIINMVMNAQNAIPGSGHIDIMTSNVTLPEMHPYKHDVIPAGRYVLLAIMDTGCGMDAGTLGRIFDPFYTTRQSEGGTGLGLSSAYAIVKQSGGIIRVYSTAGKGTTFKIFLPWKEKNENETLSVAAVTKVIKKGSTALIVDDNPHTRRFVVNGLQELGCKVFEANNGEGALIVSRSYNGEIAILITDIVMPGISGVELAKIIRHERPSTALLFMTGFQAGKLTSHYYPDENIVLLQKPFSMDDLQNALVQACSLPLEKPVPCSLQELSDEYQIRSTTVKSRDQLRILIVDDETVSAECIAFLIRKNGSVVEIAENGKRALELADMMEPDVIIMDIRLPDMDGYELAERIRGLPHCGQTRLIACSGCNPVEEKVALFDEYLIKPLDMIELMQLLSGDPLAV
jgi:PAS domain S-box-containing protein